MVRGFVYPFEAILLNLPHFYDIRFWPQDVYGLRSRVQGMFIPPPEEGIVPMPTFVFFSRYIDEYSCIQAPSLARASALLRL